MFKVFDHAVKHGFFNFKNGFKSTLRNWNRCKFTAAEGRPKVVTSFYGNWVKVYVKLTLCHSVCKINKKSFLCDSWDPLRAFINIAETRNMIALQSAHSQFGPVNLAATLCAFSSSKDLQPGTRVEIQFLFQIDVTCLQEDSHKRKKTYTNIEATLTESKSLSIIETFAVQEPLCSTRDLRYVACFLMVAETRTFSSHYTHS